MLVGQEPERVAQGDRIVVERRLASGAVTRVRSFEVEHLLLAGVVEGVAADAHVDLQSPLVSGVIEEHRAVLRPDFLGADAADGVTEKVRRLVAAQLQALVRAVELVGHGGQHALARVFLIRREGERGGDQEMKHASFVTSLTRCAPCLCRR